MDRGQTPHDYLIGVSIMLVVLFGIFAFVPGIYEPFQEPVGTEEEAMADRLSQRLVDDHAVPGTSRTLDNDALNTTMQDSDEFDSFLERSGIPAATTQTNVTLWVNQSRPVDVTGDLDNESTYHVNQTSAATSIRVVRFSNDRCESVCRLIVRIW